MSSYQSLSRSLAPITNESTIKNPNKIILVTAKCFNHLYNLTNVNINKCF